MKILDPFNIDFSGVHLIEASAGTGKTYNISSLYVRAIAEGRFSVDQILVVTYTEAATKELRDRLMKRLSEAIAVLKGQYVGDDSFLLTLKKEVTEPVRAAERLKTAVHSFDQAAVYTIHGFCQHALQQYAFNSGAPFEAELIGDDSEIIQEVVDDYWRQWVSEAPKKEGNHLLIKLMLDWGNTPENLTDELKSLLGKPYAEIKPDIIEFEKYNQAANQLQHLFTELKKIWNKDKELIYELLRSEQMNLNKYRKNNLGSWMMQLDTMLQEDTAPIIFFEKFHKFSKTTIEESLKETTSKGAPAHPFFEKADAYITKASFLKSFTVAFKRHLLDYLISNLPAKKEEYKVFSFDDVLIQFKNALQHSGRGMRLQEAMREAYPMALVDEFQDTDPVQYNIFKTIYGGREAVTLFMIGDPKQSIYGFRGADIFSYLEAKNDADKNRIFSLRDNFRSVQELIAGINALFTSHDHPFILEDIEYEPVRSGLNTDKHLVIDKKIASPLKIRRLLTPESNKALTKGEARNRSAQDTAAQIQQLLAQAAQGTARIGEAPVQAKDIAVLVRKHRQAELISDALRERGIKSVKRSRESVFHSEEAHELTYVLHAIAEPANEPHVMSALSCRMFGYDAQQLQKINENESEWAAMLDRFSEWHAQWQQHGFAYMFRNLMQTQQVSTFVMKLENGERKLTNLIHLSELIAQKEKQQEKGIHSMLKWFIQKRHEQNKDAEEEQVRLESDENLVSVITMHQSKGLEYPVVFCPFLWSGSNNQDRGQPVTYHSPDNEASIYIDLNGKEDPERSQKRFLQAKEELAESVRLAYVAITRAKYRCIIHWVNATESAHSPLGFLLLGSSEAFASLKASVTKGKRYDKSLQPMLQQTFKKLGKYQSISCDVISEHTYQFDLFCGEHIPAMKTKSFTRTLPLPPGPATASFSSLIQTGHEEFEKDYAAYFDERADEEEHADEAGNTIFDFPRGPNPGTAVHHIFENILFNNPQKWAEIIREILQARDIDTRWTAVVNQMVRTIVHRPLLQNQPSFTLSKLNPKRMITELEFYFTIGQVRLEEIIKIIRPDLPRSFSLKGFADEGFLKGFIDLTFEFEGRYYILDYKTNFLGTGVENYHSEILNQEIKEAMYDLQYHIYIIALHRFLKNKLKNYSYSSHVGGAFYLFVRGMNDKGNEGIFFDRPDRRIIQQLDNYLI